jgi:hypothetical protein
MSTRRRVQFSRVHYPTTLLVLVLGVLASVPDASAQNNLTPLQRRARAHLSGSAAIRLQQQTQRQASVLAPLASASNFFSALNMNTLVLPRNYFPAAGDQCSETIGTNVKVNQNCMNLTDSGLQGIGQAAEETAIAQDPNHPNHLVAASNDWHGGWFGVRTHYSVDGGQHWRDSTPPIGVTTGTFGIEFWEQVADPSVAWDTKGNAYMAVLPSNGIGANPDMSSGVYVFRSTLNNGASWNFPARPVFEFNQVAGGPFQGEDKPYITVDDHVGSPFQDRIYVSWIEILADGSIYVWESYSDDYGETFSPRVLVSGNNTTLCTVAAPFGGTTQGNCNQNWFPQPFTGPDGALYVVFANYNSSYSPQPSNCPGLLSPGNTNPCDNHSQILLAKSTNGGVSFSPLVKVADYYDLPDCATYQGQNGQNGGYPCVPEKGSTMNSTFRVINNAIGAVHPKHPNTVVVAFDSYINAHSNESNGCTPGGINPTTFQDFYTGVKTPGACGNHILLSVSNDGGHTFSGGTTDVRLLPTVNQAKGQNTTDQWFPWAAFTRSGELVVSYYDRSYGNDETTGSMDISLSGSYDGIHFQTTRVTSSSMPLPTQFVGDYIAFMGDYLGLSAVDDVHVIWTDTRDSALSLCPGTGQPGVPPALCNTTAPNGVTANNEEIFTRELDAP